MDEDKKSRKILTVEQIKSIVENRGFTFKKFTFETSGRYTVKDSMFNHRDKEINDVNINQDWTT